MKVGITPMPPPNAAVCSAFRCGDAGRFSNQSPVRGRYGSYRESQTQQGFFRPTEPRYRALGYVRVKPDGSTELLVRPLVIESIPSGLDGLSLNINRIAADYPPLPDFK